MALSKAMFFFLLFATVTAGSESDDDDYRDLYPEIFTNQTYSRNRITIKEDHHVYYNSTTVTDEGLAHRLWMELADREDVHVHPMLSQSHRRATTVQLSFDFPFYGHPVRNVTLSTGGFVYLGDFIHSWLAAAQYVAPLMANFDTSISDDSFVKYLDNGTAFTVQWERVRLQDRAEAGDFSFQLTLHSSGDIVFVYQNVPLPVEDIADYQHPVKVGISDSYVTETNVYFVRRKTIYEYHRVAFSHEDIQNGTVIVLSAQPTCRSAEDCHTCLTAVPHFQCRWCEGMCSDGTDRRRQEWLQHSCDERGVASVELCPANGAQPEEGEALLTPQPEEGEALLTPQLEEGEALLTPQPEEGEALLTPQPEEGEAPPQAQEGKAAVHASEPVAQPVEAARSQPQRTGGGLHAQGPASSSTVSVSGVVATLSAVVTLVLAMASWAL